MTPYSPAPLPIEAIDYNALVEVMGEANRELVRYDGLLQGIPNPSVLLSPLANQEAVMSSKIEGTQVTLGEVLEFEAGGELDTEGKRLDVQEITNYRSALFMAANSLNDQPITLGFIRQIHGVLMDSVRGQDKRPGQFRIDQNWIGPKGRPLEEATFVPPSPIGLIDHLEAWEKYLRVPDRDPLVQAAVVHAQFELIHPFNDGNGRVGRLLIPLFLHSHGILSGPNFYLSEYLDHNRDEYIDRLAAISKANDWHGWVEFFLQGVTFQARKNSAQVKDIHDLYNEMKVTVQQVTRSQYSAALVDAIFSFPISNSSLLTKFTGAKPQSILKMIRQLRDAGVLCTVREKSGRAPAIYAFPELVNITEGKQVFKKLD